MKTRVFVGRQFHLWENFMYHRNAFHMRPEYEIYHHRTMSWNRRAEVLKNTTCIYGAHQAKTYLLACAKCADSDHPAHAQSFIRALLCIETFYSIQLFRLCTADAQADLGLCCTHMPEDTFSHGAAHMSHANYHCRTCRELWLIRIKKTCLFKYTENFTTKEWKNPYKNSDIFHISAHNIDCGYAFEPPRRVGSNEYPQSIFLSRHKENNVYPCKPQFY